MAALMRSEYTFSTLLFDPLCRAPIVFPSHPCLQLPVAAMSMFLVWSIPIPFAGVWCQRCLGAKTPSPATS